MRAGQSRRCGRPAGPPRSGGCTGSRIAMRNPHGHCGSSTHGVRRQTGQSHRSDAPQCGHRAEPALRATGLNSVTPAQFRHRSRVNLAAPLTPDGAADVRRGQRRGSLGDGCHRSRLARDAQPPADPADQAIGAVGGDPQRGGLLDRAARVPGSSRLKPLEGELGQAVERLLGLEGQGPVVARPRPG